MLQRLFTVRSSSFVSIVWQRMAQALLVLLVAALPFSAMAQPIDWTQVNSDGFGDANNGGVPAMAVFNSYLYAGTFNSSAGGEVWHTGGTPPPAEIAKLTAGDAASGKEFGGAVAISGDTAVIGASYDAHAGSESGAAYVFQWDGVSWIQQAKLVASDAAADDWFGVDVSIDGDTIIVGALRDDNNGTENAGSAYVFQRNGTAWTQQAKLTTSDTPASRQFGKAVSISGDTVIVGAWQDGAQGSYAGAAYVFQRSGVVWTQQAKLTASDAASSDFFGFDVAISGDTAVVGAIYDDDGASGAGSAYVFQREGVNWPEQQKLTASDIGDSFGNAVALDGDTILIGSYTKDVGGASTAGAAYVFEKSAATWIEQQKLTASDADTSDQFGWSVAINGDVVLVGAITIGKSGFGYTFSRTGATWTQQQKLVASDAATDDGFGDAVAIDKDMIVIGAPGDDDEGSDSGSAYVYQIPQQAQPGLSINYKSGSPGSFFTLTGENFPSDSTATITANGHVLGSASTDSSGDMVFLLNTDQADEGYYTTIASVNPSATARFFLDAAEPLRPQEGTGSVFNVPSGIAYTNIVYLPLILR
jgi:hypothetical protein